MIPVFSGASGAEWISLGADVWSGFVALLTVLAALVGLASWRHQMHATSRFEAAREYLLSFYSLSQTLTALQVAMARGSISAAKQFWQQLEEAHARFTTADQGLAVLVDDIPDQLRSKISVRLLEVAEKYINFVDSPPQPESKISDSMIALKLKSPGLTELDESIKQCLRPHLRPPNVLDEIIGLFGGPRLRRGRGVSKNDCMTANTKESH